MYVEDERLVEYLSNVSSAIQLPAEAIKAAFGTTNHMLDVQIIIIFTNIVIVVISVQSLMRISCLASDVHPNVSCYARDNLYS